MTGEDIASKWASACRSLPSRDVVGELKPTSLKPSECRYAMTWSPRTCPSYISANEHSISTWSVFARVSFAPLSASYWPPVYQGIRGAPEPDLERNIATVLSS